MWHGLSRCDTFSGCGLALVDVCVASVSVPWPEWVLMGTVGVSMTQRVWHVFNECGMAYLCVSRPQLVWHGV